MDDNGGEGAMSATSDKIAEARVKALRLRLDANGSGDAESLSRSYALPLAVVSAELEAWRYRNGKA
jgi:hypothetical protein